MIKDLRKYIKTREKLIVELEPKIAKQCYNPNSYNGWTGEEGCSFRYPLSYCRTRENLDNLIISQTKSLHYNIDPDCIGTMKYKFGSNHLYIGDGLNEVLDYLEERYDINFEEMEFQFLNERMERMMEIKQDFDDDPSEFKLLHSGWYTVGLDFPSGAYYFRRINGYGMYIENYSFVDIVKASGDYEEYDENTRIWLKDEYRFFIHEDCYVSKKKFKSIF